MHTGVTCGPSQLLSRMPSDNAHAFLREIRRRLPTYTNRALSTWAGKGTVWFVMFGCRGSSQADVTVPPDLEGSRSQESWIRRSQQMASHSETILDYTV